MDSKNFFYCLALFNFVKVNVNIASIYDRWTSRFDWQLLVFKALTINWGQGKGGQD